jgi:HEAT repeat protein
MRTLVLLALVMVTGAAFRSAALGDVGPTPPPLLENLFPSAPQQEPPPIEEWQVKGILAALQDGYPEVRDRALDKLLELLGAGGGHGQPPHAPDANGEWRPNWEGNSLQIARELVPFLREKLKVRRTVALGEAFLGPDHALADAVHALAELGANDGETLQALHELLKDQDFEIVRVAALALEKLGGGDEVTRKALRDVL